MTSLREKVDKSINTVMYQPTPKEYVFIIGGMVFKGRSEEEAWNNFVKWLMRGGGTE